MNDQKDRMIKISPDAIKYNGKDNKSIENDFYNLAFILYLLNELHPY